MADIDYPRFARLLIRTGEIAAGANMKPEVVQTYDQVLKAIAASYLALDKDVTKAETAFAKENRERLEALADLDGPFRTARAVVAAHVEGTVVPETLKTQPTDTEKVKAIEDLIDAIDDYVGQPWADALLSGEFGTKAPVTVKEIKEAMAANTALSKAAQKRAEGYGPAHGAFIKFKAVVRNALGPKSIEYRRIHLRSVDDAEVAKKKDEAKKDPEKK